MNSASLNPEARPLDFRIKAILFVAAGCLVLMFIHHGAINGSPYHRWRWRSLPFFQTWPFILPFAIPFFWGQHIYHKRPNSIRLALGLVTLSCFLIMVVAEMTRHYPPSWYPISSLLLDNGGSGYFGAAANLKASGLSITQILAQYPQLLPSFDQHPSIKPPGPLLFCYMFINAFGPRAFTALLVGLSIGIVATLAVPATYAFITFYTGDRRAAFFGSSYLALCPCLLLFFPEFDQCYIVLSVLLAITWSLALDKDRLALAAAFGLLFAASLFTTYLLSVLVFFLAGLTLLKLRSNPSLKIPRIATHAAVALLAFVAFYAALWLTTHYNPIATFRTCMALQKRNMHVLELYYGYGRHLPGTAPWDLYDFALGSGWISFMILAYHLWSTARTTPRPPTTTIVMLCIAQFVFVAVTGLIQCETARVWMFMLPMLMTPIGLELSRWNYRMRTTLYVTLLLISLSVFRNMVFFYLQFEAK